MPQINWLHLTDLHMGMRDQKHLLPAIKDRFKADLKTLHNKSGPWDLVVFTGDLTQRAAPEEFKQLDAFLDELWHWFAELGSNPRLVAVPGNHDLVRPDAGLLEVMLLGHWKDDQKLRDLFWSTPTSPCRQIVDAAFANYKAWWEKTPHKLAGGKTGIVPGDISFEFAKDGVSIGIVGLNSSFLQLRDENYLGGLAISPHQFHAVCDDDGPKWARKHHACLLMTHHPPDWLTVESRAELRSDIASSDYCALHLFGHMHEARFEANSTAGTPPAQTFQGSSLFGREYIGDPKNKVERRHGYAAGRIEPVGEKGRLTLWPRDAKLPGGQWNFAPSAQEFRLKEEAMAGQEFALLRPLAAPPAPAPQPIFAPGLLPQPPVRSGPRRWAVVVGINSYQTDALQFCGNDAREIASVLRDELGFDGVYEIREDTEIRPNRDAIFEKLVAIRNSDEVQPDDVFIFYFSGHGVQEKGKDYLLPMNASFRDATTLGVPLEALSTQLASIGCKNTAILVDACRETAQGAKGAAASIGDSSRDLLLEAGIIAFFSCGPQDRSYEIVELEHGSFTYCVLQAIREGLGTTVAELESYLKKNVPLVNRRHNKPPQQPYAVFSPSDRGVLELLLNPNRAVTVSLRFNDIQDALIQIMDAYPGKDLTGALVFIARLRTRPQLDGTENQKLSRIEDLVESFQRGDLDEREIDVFLKYWSRTLSRVVSTPQLQPKKPSGLK